MGQLKFLFLLHVYTSLPILMLLCPPYSKFFFSVSLTSLFLDTNESRLLVVFGKNIEFCHGQSGTNLFFTDSFDQDIRSIFIFYFGRLGSHCRVQISFYFSELQIPEGRDHFFSSLSFIIRRKGEGLKERDRKRADRRENK